MRYSTSLLATFSAGALVACTTSGHVTTVAQNLSSEACPAGVPAALVPAADQHLAFALDATGVQKYTCAATATGYAWTFVAPDAQLFERHDDGEREDPVGHHFAGPTWQYEDGSSVVAKKVAGAVVEHASIPWLLLVATSHGGATATGDEGDDDGGRMTPVTSIQRLSTTGGLAPATGCDAAHVGAGADVAYTATYFFYRTRADHPNNVRCGS